MYIFGSIKKLFFMYKEVSFGKWKGWKVDPKKMCPYSFIQNVSQNVPIENSKDDHDF